MAVRSASVASHTGKAADAGPVSLPLALASAYEHLAEASGGLYATVTLRFSSLGHAPLQTTIQVTFRRAPHKVLHGHRRNRKRKS